MKFLKINTYHHEEEFSTTYININELRSLSYYDGCDHLQIETNLTMTEGRVKSFTLRQFEDFIKSDKESLLLIEFESFHHSDGTGLDIFRERLIESLKT